ncbi:nucleoside ABC transporter ATP-binding protein [Salinihabitans flavidus]|uniref:Nucleoside ABC transporter ATP-binding protein n=1 Tax=Salinihabitans flavidus TaxID=569882 RepID=A0A1H8VN41_9RHOB|nr:ATP-binding cassette domain-containing protein [Salinihabitans flavidus]SEP16825.1 nucleoside ABC transporter ATP-binding protein [Salinihabitans flavidus]
MMQTNHAAHTTVPVLELAHLSKSYGEVRAVAGLSLSLNPGEVVALLGENGAGKSTVVNMITGMTRPNSGQIRVRGKEVLIASPRDALDRGIGVVHQHYALVGDFTVAETLALGRAGPGRLNRQALHAEVRRVAERIGMQIEAGALIGSLDVAGQQRVEILKALSREVGLLVLDEPTAVLSPEDVARLFDVVRALRADGVAILMVTHRLADVFAVCDRAAVMHSGQLVCDLPVMDVTSEGLISAMISGSTDTVQESERMPGDVMPARQAAPANDAPTRVSVRDLALRRANGSQAVQGLSFDIRAGEIMALAGVDGNGQSELVQCLAGVNLPDGGTAEICNCSSDGPWSPRVLRHAGVAHVPDDRRRQAIISDLSLGANMILSHVFSRRYGRAMLDWSRARDDTSRAIDEYDIRTTGPDQPIGRLSGGNQQKLVLARELLAGPKVILAAHPSRGLDIRTIGAVQNILRQQRDAGAAILLVSADLDEIRALADRVVVLAAGGAFGPVDMAQTDTAQIGAWMAGHT